jgi:hypothetical protein
MRASVKEIKEQAAWILQLANKLNSAAENLSEGYDKYHFPCRDNGTITNLSPELSKAASKLKKMAKFGYLP